MTSSSRLKDSDDTGRLLERAKDGDQRALDELFARHRGRLRRMVDMRMAPSLRRRIDASDVIQEAFLEAARRLPDFVDKRAESGSMPFFLWLRWLTRERLITLHRRHLGTRARDPRREIAMHAGSMPEANSEGLAAQLLGNLTSPSQAAVRAETRVHLQQALDELEPREREILALRHFEQLSNGEAARELGIGEAAASKRYIRALTRLRGIMMTRGLSLSSLSPRRR